MTKPWLNYIRWRRQKNGMRFDNRYCWVCTFESNVITRVRAHLDSAMVAPSFEENPIA
jgi:uncharacterized protein